MSTTTKRAPRTPVVYATKSDRARALLIEGRSIAEIEKIMTREGSPMGYAFIYGVAARTPHPDGGTYARTAANRRPTRAVSKDADGSVTVQTTAGPVKVMVDGTVTRGRKTWKVTA